VLAFESRVTSYTATMSRRFERLAGNAEAWIIGAVVVGIAIAYVISRLHG